MKGTNGEPTLLSLDDDVEIGKIIEAVGEKAGFKTTVTDTAQSFCEQLQTLDPDVVALDLQVPDMDGVQLLRRLGDIGVRSGLVLITGMDRRTVVSAEQYAVKRGLRVLATVQKPFLPDDLLRTFLSAKALSHPLEAEDFERAIENGQLHVYYQPVARAQNGAWEIDSVEALLRWEHPERGILLPDSFLGLGKDHTLSREMTDFVIRRGLEQLKGWHAVSLDLALRANLSAGLITDIEFPDRLETTLEEFEIPGSSLMIEVNETTMLQEQPETLDILTRLRLKEVRLAIDDFGIGYSSLTQLFRMPFCEMKIDRSLIARVSESKETQISIEALIDLAHKLGLEVCGEGVENQQALDFLARAGCDVAQGFLLSPPVRPQEIPGVIRRWQERTQESAALAGSLAKNVQGL